MNAPALATNHSIPWLHELPRIRQYLYSLFMTVQIMVYITMRYQDLCWVFGYLLILMGQFPFVFYYSTSSIYLCFVAEPRVGCIFIFIAESGFCDDGGIVYRVVM